MELEEMLVGVNEQIGIWVNEQENTPEGGYPPYSTPQSQILTLKKLSMKSGACAWGKSSLKLNGWKICWGKS